MMEVTRNMAQETLSLTEDTILCGPCRFAKVTTNGFVLTVSTLAHHGITIDGSKDPAAWGANVRFTVPVYPLNATHVIVVEEVDNEAVTFRGEAEAWGGEQILAAWDYWVEIVHGDPDITEAELQTAWIAWASSVKNIIYFSEAIGLLMTRFSAADWPAMRAKILSKSVAAWKGEPVSTGEVIS